MEKLVIRTYPDKVLHEKSDPIRKVGEKERKLAYGMIQTMRSSDGVGIAAPQVGIKKRIIVVQDIENNNAAMVLVNPKIIKKKGRASFCEGCLSVPGVNSDVTRPESVIVEALNLDGEPIKIDTGGLFARVIQHEIDHLDGILFIDRIGFLKRKKIIKKIAPNICMEL